MFVFFCSFCGRLIVFVTFNTLAPKSSRAASHTLVFVPCCLYVSLQHGSKSASTSWMWLLRSSVIIANKPWPRITLTMTTTALILIMAVFNMVSLYVYVLKKEKRNNSYGLSRNELLQPFRWHCPVFTNSIVNKGMLKYSWHQFCKQALH